VTCIVGLVNDNTIYMGGDRAASDDSSIVSMKNPKVCIRDEWIYGYAGTIGIGQLINYIDLPSPEGDIEKIIRLDICESLKTMIDIYARDIENEDTGFLIGAKGRLFEFNVGDWGVLEVTESSIGSGSQIALGSLHTSIDADPIDRVGIALGAAITYSPSCQGPIDIIYI
jgi:hypothetical protein